MCVFIVNRSNTNPPFEGGHLKPDPYSRAASILKTHGPAVAEHVASFEARQVEEVKAFVEREGIECDFEETRVFDVCLHQAGRDKAEADLAALTDADISTVRDVGYYSDQKAEEVCIIFFESMTRQGANASRRSRA